MKERTGNADITFKEVCSNFEISNVLCDLLCSLLDVSLLIDV